MQNALQAIFQPGIGKYRIAHLFPVQAALLIKKFLSESFRYTLQRGLPRLDNFMCNLVGIDDRYAPLNEKL